jgi:hypothetical protein
MAEATVARAATTTMGVKVCIFLCAKRAWGICKERRRTTGRDKQRKMVVVDKS